MLGRDLSNESSEKNTTKQRACQFLLALGDSGKVKKSFTIKSLSDILKLEVRNE